MKKKWEMKKLGEVCGFQNGFSFKSNLYKGHGFPILRISNIQNEKIDNSDIVFFNPNDYQVNFEKYQITKGDLVIAMSGATTGKLGINTTDTTYYLNQRVGKFLPQKGLSKKYLYYYLSTKVEESLRISAGAAQPNLSLEQINNFIIPFPPLPEQQRIVTLLDETFASLTKVHANAERNQVNAREVFESVLDDEVNHARKGWKEMKLDDACIVERGSSPRPIKRYQTTSKDGVNWIKIGDTKGVEKYIFSTREKITKEGAKQSRFVKEGDLILTNSMSYGYPYIMKTEGYIHDGWFVLRLKDSIDTEFFWYLLASPFVQSQFQQLASGAIVKNISGDLVKKANLFIPPLAEQRAIVQRLDALAKETRRLEEVYRSKVEAVEELRRSVLGKAFAGEL